jgi:hypothetical protein
MKEIQIHMFLKTFNERYLGTHFLLVAKMEDQWAYIFDRVYYKMDRNHIDIVPIEKFEDVDKTIFYIPNYGMNWQVFYLI